MDHRRGRIAAAVLALLLLVTFVTAKGSNPALYPPKTGDAVAIFLVDNGFHSDIAVPLSAIETHDGPLARAAAATTGSPWVLVGWGDAQFYEDQSPWQDRILDGLAALFGGRPTVVHLQGVGESPDLNWRDGVHRIAVSRAGLAALMARADRSFRLGADSGPVQINATAEVGEGFFVSGEGFSLVHLCNHWAAGLLHAAGLPTTPVLDTLPAGLVLDLKLRAGLEGHIPAPSR
jgi:uncharacterized protein (TIGR02117 family)